MCDKMLVKIYTNYASYIISLKQCEKKISFIVTPTADRSEGTEALPPTHLFEAC